MQYIFENDVYSAQLLKKIEELNFVAMQHNKGIVDPEYVKYAIAFAKYYHAGQLRKSGEPYYSHPIAVAGLALEHEFNLNIACGALLHDVVEDNRNCTCEMICKEFGFRVAEIVYQLTRLRHGEKVGIPYIIQQIIALQDQETKIIKLMDRVHNINTIQYMSPEKQRIYAWETLQYFLALSEHANEIQVEEELYRKCLDILNVEINFSYQDDYRLQSLAFENNLKKYKTL